MRLNLYIAVIVLQILKSNDQLLVARTTKRLGFVWSGTHTHTHTHTSARVCIYIYIYIYICVCVCVRACVCLCILQHMKNKYYILQVNLTKGCKDSKIITYFSWHNTNNVALQNYIY